MLPYSALLLLSGIILTVLWVVLGLPLGPGAGVEFNL
jgi:aminobenzoyl-glutamate transport protein